MDKQRAPFDRRGTTLPETQTGRYPNSGEAFEIVRQLLIVRKQLDAVRSASGLLETLDQLPDYVRKQFSENIRNDLVVILSKLPKGDGDAVFDEICDQKDLIRSKVNRTIKGLQRFIKSTQETFIA